jgi:hypothetical protein
MVADASLAADRMMGAPLAATVVGSTVEWALMMLCHRVMSHVRHTPFTCRLRSYAFFESLKRKECRRDNNSEVVQTVSIEAVVIGDVRGDVEKRETRMSARAAVVPHLLPL